ncbi:MULTISPECIES: multidrug effflux MFS transporter [unclassified Janthinobacterium]|uniref:multidrug effflux MFS transporter n=1 Tax=unclassified Janthinobacterium TaxID=2610881 RepID=UPI0003475212|nr:MULTISPECIES: multidrug effflux MFS transporter [unclassified Janthinobacterium]MEC5162404.1 DHA1 family bicyclomycin/chloramphenicol resistance-like MFS transporter [Janthinobacterium sp. CG_S6]
MFPTPTPNIPADPVTPVPPPPPSHMAPLSGVALATMLALLAMLGPFSIDTYLPAFPAIQASLNASAIEVQQSLTVYMLAFAGMVLWHGALSDSFGRRNLILISLALFAIGTLGCAAASTVHYLWAFRVLQGVSAGAGVVVGRAIIRDLYSDAPAARLLSMVTMIFSIAPAIAPIMGGWIVKLLDWRAIFLFLFAYTLILLWFCYKRLPETLPPHLRQPFNPHYIARNYRQILSAPLFHMKAGVTAFNFAGLFLFITAAPVMLPRHLHLGPDQFGWLFIPAVSGIFLGALAANRLAGSITLVRQIGIGFALLLGAAVCNVGYHLLFAPSLPWSVAPLFFYTFGMSLVTPGATMLAMDLFPHIRGTVASCQSFAQTLLGALVAGVIAPFLSHSVLWLAAGQLACAAISLALWIASRLFRERWRKDVAAPF